MWVTSQGNPPQGSLLPKYLCLVAKEARDVRENDEGRPKVGMLWSNITIHNLGRMTVSLHTKPLSCTTEKGLKLGMGGDLALRAIGLRSMVCLMTE